MRTFSYLFFSILLFYTVKAQAPFANFDSYIENGMKAWQIPGMSVAVVKNGKVIYAKGYGVKEINKTEKVDENTLFGIGSNTKAFTSTALTWLEYERKINLNDKVQRFFPTFQMEDTFATKEMSYRDLLCHRLGIPTWYGDFTHWGSKYSKQELIQKMRYIPAAYSFRTRFGYCNVSYMLAGEVIPKIYGGKTWEDVMRERFFVPLKMSRTCTSTDELAALGNVATPHTLWRKQVTTLPWRNIDNVAACGSINSSAVDMSHWLIAQMDSGRLDGKAIIPWRAIEQTHIPQIVLPAMPYKNPIFPASHFSAYGLGWFLKDYCGKMLIYHSGAVDGMVSMTAMLPEENFGIVILTNHDTHNFISALMYQALDAQLKLPYKDWHQFFMDAYKKEKEENRSKEIDEQRDINTRPSLELAKYAGYYFHPHYGQMTIRYQNGELIVLPSGHPNTTGKLMAWNGDMFVCEWTDKVWDRSTFRFTIENDKVINFDMLTQPDILDPMAYLFERLE